MGIYLFLELCSTVPRFHHSVCIYVELHLRRVVMDISVSKFEELLMDCDGAVHVRWDVYDRHTEKSKHIGGITYSTSAIY